MGQSLYSTRTRMDVSGADFCNIFGHRAKKYGDGIFCLDCDIPMTEKDLPNYQELLRTRANQAKVPTSNLQRLVDGIPDIPSSDSDK